MSPFASVAPDAISFQMPPHDLAAARQPRQRIGEADLIGSRELPDLAVDVLRQLRLHRAVGDLPALERHEDHERVALQLVGLPHGRGLGHRGVAHERALDLGRADAVARDVEHVVDAPDDPEVAVLIAARRRRP